MDETLVAVLEVMHGASGADAAIRPTASGQLLAYFREPGFAGVLSVRTICHSIFPRTTFKVPYEQFNR